MSELPEWAELGRVISVMFAIAIYILCWSYSFDNDDRFSIAWTIIHGVGIVIALVIWFVNSWTWKG